MRCPICGGSMCGDGYTEVRHCEFTEQDISCLEPDGPCVYCVTVEDIDQGKVTQHE